MAATIHEASVDMLRFELDGIAATQTTNLRTAGAIKVTAARLGEEVAEECVHIVGGSAFLVDEIPLARRWRDVKPARVCGGTDDVLSEQAAASSTPDEQGYRPFAMRIS